MSKILFSILSAHSRSAQWAWLTFDVRQGMNRALTSFLFLATLLLAACTVRQSVYKRFELPKGLDETTEQQVFLGVVQALRSQPFVDELKKRFPSVTQAQL